MGFHTYDPDRAENLADPTRFAYLSVDELLALFEPTGDDEIVDLGSGTGFYTNEIAPYAGQIHAVDVQPEMHDLYREAGVPDTVRLVTAEAADLPFADDAIDAVVSTMTYHEFATESSLAELARVVVPGGCVAIGDWTRQGEGERGPPLDQRFDAATAREHFEDAGFTVERVQDRRETFVLAATN